MQPGGSVAVSPFRDSAGYRDCLQTCGVREAGEPAQQTASLDGDHSDPRLLVGAVSVYVCVCVCERERVVEHARCAVCGHKRILVTETLIPKS